MVCLVYMISHFCFASLYRSRASRFYYFKSLLYMSIIFIADRKNCEGLKEKTIDLGYNAASFYWNPKVGARVSFSFFLICLDFIFC